MSVLVSDLEVVQYDKLQLPPTGKAFIYALIDPTTNEIRYVGKPGESLNGRRNRHVKEAVTIRNYRCNWIKGLVRAGTTPDVVLLRMVPVKNWQIYEVMWIKHLRKLGARLVNGTDGGEGSYGRVFSDDTILKMKTSHTGQKLSIDRKEALKASWIGHHHTEASKAKIGKASKGRTHSDVTRKKMSDSHKGKPLSEPHKNNISVALTGRVVADDTKQKISVANKGLGKGRKLPKEQVEKTRNALIGRKHSDERRAKQSASMIGKNVGRKQSQATKDKRNAAIKKTWALKRLGLDKDGNPI